jgi:hypothetical protein
MRMVNVAGPNSWVNVVLHRRKDPLLITLRINGDPSFNDIVAHVDPIV